MRDPSALPHLRPDANLPSAKRLLPADLGKDPVLSSK